VFDEHSRMRAFETQKAIDVPYAVIQSSIQRPSLP
jgi:hypothetical protein